jgi:DNA-binding transcriptional MerR regulator
LAGAEAGLGVGHACLDACDAGLGAVPAALDAVQAALDVAERALDGGQQALVAGDAALVGAGAALAGYERGMEYLIADLVERSGLAPRTIRSYIALRIIPAPVVNGPAAVYGDEHLLRLVAATRMRAEGASLNAVAAKLGTMSLPQVRAYVRRTEPRPADPSPAAPQPAPAAEPPVLDGEPVSTRRKLPRDGAAAGADLVSPWTSEGASLPPTAHWGIFPLLPGMALMVREDAAPIVKSAAAEILGRFGAQS